MSIDSINSAIDGLNSFFGFKEDVRREEIFFLIQRNNLEKALKAIAIQLGLPVKVNIIYVNENKFQSSGVAAQVMIPSHLPFYGSSALINYPITVKIHKQCIKNLDVFTMIMAHELSHILLHSLRHTKKDDEIYTDLTAIMLGFKSVFQNGRKVKSTSVSHGFLTTTTYTNTTTYGYLSDQQFDFAIQKISTILEKNRGRKRILFKRTKLLNKTLNNYKKNYSTFLRLKKYLSENKQLSKKISPQDGKKISLCFQLSYKENIEIAIKKFENKILEIDKFYKGLNQYTEKNLEKLEEYVLELSKITIFLKKIAIELKSDNKVMRKNTDMFFKLRTIFS